MLPPPLRRLSPLLSGVLLTLILSCSKSNSSSSKVERPSSAVLVGTWESEELTIRIHSAFGIADSTVILQANRDNWQDKMGLEPIVTTFRPDNTFSAIYRELDGSLRSESSGYFELISQDSLIIRRVKPGVETIRHAWVMKNDSVYGFSSTIDYDRDGERDDEMFALNRRISR